MREKFTIKQISEMLHAIGGKVTMGKLPRNYFITDGKCDSWENLCERGYAKKYESEISGTTYLVTQKGRRLLLHLN
jgi:hypothetical protein